MTDFLNNIQTAWLGWKNYTDGGKLAALLLAALLFLWCNREQVRELSLLLYASFMTICCIVPVTAALLLIYQTKFYDYEWIWSLVPGTAVTAYGMTLFLTGRWEDFKASRWREGIPLALLLLLVLLLAGGMGSRPWDNERENSERQQAREVLEHLLEMTPDGEVCLWAPREIMEYAREVDGRIKLPYGRNMWDVSLSAYSYDTYDEKILGLCKWMEQTEAADTADYPETALEECVRTALDMGVDCILLPGDTDAETVKKMEKALRINARLWEGYWIFYGRAD